MRMERKAGDSFAIESQWNGDNELADPSGFLSFAVVFELEGESSQAFFFTHSVEQPSGRDFINIWKYLKQRGAF